MSSTKVLGPTYNEAYMACTDLCQVARILRMIENNTKTIGNYERSLERSKQLLSQGALSRIFQGIDTKSTESYMLRVARELGACEKKDQHLAEMLKTAQNAFIESEKTAKEARFNLAEYISPADEDLLALLALLSK